MAAINRIQRTSIDGWHKFSVGENFGLYVIAIKESSTEDDAMSIDELKSLVIEVGIDSGIVDQPLPIQRLSLKFSDYTTTKNGKTIVHNSMAHGMTSKLPKEDIYIRVVAFSDGIQEKLQGSMPVSINTVTII